MPMSRKQYLDCIKRDINQAKNSELLLEVFLITTGCCKECDKLTGKRMPLKDAIKYKPLPYSKCIRETGCICCYGFESVRDENGRLIRNKDK